MKRFLLCVVLSLCAINFSFSQTNLSVDLDDPVYDIIDYIELRGYTKYLHNSRPYSLDLVLDTLYDAIDHPDISSSETKTIRDTIERLKPAQPTYIPKDATFWQGVGTIGSTGFYRYESTEESFPATAQIGANFEINLASNFNEPNISNFDWLTLYIVGDLGTNFSYNVNMGMGIMKLDYNAYKPYSFSQFWGGYLYYIDDPSNFAGASEELMAAVQLEPEFSASFFDNRLGLSFARIRRDWGTGNGNLLLSETAQPFTGIEMYLRPVDFISLSSMTGILEYYRESGIKTDATTFQNAFSAFMGEVFIGDYVYLGINSTAIWPKRFELGYLIPGMIPFFYQNMIGDFDNLQMGLSFGINAPKHANFYFNIFMDELNLASEDFFHKDRNMYAYQTGLNVAIPNSPLVTFNFQYTKVEPYMYTHPGAIVPWYDQDVRMETNYVNHGENLGYNLHPNSDELKISANAIPFWYLKTSLQYSLVRHGLNENDGNYISDKLDYSDVNAGTKYFLTDGTYEWIHSVGANAELDLRFVKDIPLSLNLGYTLSFTHHTEPDTLNKSFKPVNSGSYKNTWGNYMSLSVKVW